MKFTIPFRLPGLNEYINLNRGSRYGGNKLKQDIENHICLCIRSAGLKPTGKPVTLHFTWYEETMRRDKDNVAFAKKFILDALQKAGVLPQDGNRYVSGFYDEFIYHSGQKVVVELEAAHDP